MAEQQDLQRKQAPQNAAKQAAKQVANQAGKPATKAEPPLRAELSTQAKRFPDISGVHGVFFQLISALHEHYSKNDEDPTIQMQIYEVQDYFLQGDRATAWKHAIQILSDCIDVDLKQS